ncbi:DUF5330 domain-containing protein [Methyloligella sp. 2.7D]|uniref:DUF5330 domain-containing protein n=1 Tax=unclassified Methyloligella TaxID=2625955 RepID=UPI00157E1202|nr:DUF5330 domain-containing protein [Methyloligella sp. GL2]QKP77094.1 DUF5330 domain-containing protein [Methyloligella sp. GL2]
MFLIRFAFWIVIIILLLPTDRQQQTDVLGTAQTAIQDVSGFCQRNPDACIKSKDAFNIFMAKAEFGANMVMSFFNEHGQSIGQGTATIDPTAPTAQAEAPTVLVAPKGQPAGFDPNSDNTLTPADLLPEWRKPQGT